MDPLPADRPLMMMAPDSSSPPPRRLSPETIEVVKASITSYVRAPHAGAGSMHESLHRMAAEARESSVLPEQLLVMLKEIWYSLPEVAEISDQAEQVKLLQRVVTMCIQEYYS